MNMYEHERIEIEVQVEEGEKALDVFNKVKEFVNILSSDNKSDNLKEYYQKIVDNPNDHKYSLVQEATKKLEEYDSIPSYISPF